MIFRCLVLWLKLFFYYEGQNNAKQYNNDSEMNK